MPQSTTPVPPGYRTMTPYLIVRGGAAAIDFYARAFGAEVVTRTPAPDGKSIMHASLQIGDSRLMLSEECVQWGSLSPLSLGGSGSLTHLYVTDVDASVARAAAAGATVKMAPADMFWGDRYAQLVDPFGHAWSVATHIEDLTPEEMGERAKAMFAKSPDCK